VRRAFRSEDVGRRRWVGRIEGRRWGGEQGVSLERTFGGGEDKMGREGKRAYVLHALGATSPVTVVEFEAFALEDECADAILEDCQRSCGDTKAVRRYTYLASCHHS